MDMGEGIYEVHDYKTGSSLPKQDELDQDRQLAMYSFWVRNNFKDFKKVRLVWHFLAFDKEMDSYRTKEQLDELKKEVLAQIRKIEAAEEFPANVSWLCDWCLYRPICPMWSHGVELEQKQENEYLDDPGLKLVDEFVRIKGALDEHRREGDEKLEKIKEALIVFSQRQGVQVVFGSENKITVKEYESIKLPGKGTAEREKLIHILERIGRLEEVSDLNVYALAKILDNKDWEQEELDKLSSFWVKEKNFRLTVSKK